MSNEDQAAPASEEQTQDSVSVEEYNKAKELAENYKRRAEKAEAAAKAPQSELPEDVVNTINELKAKVETRELNEKFSKVAGQFFSENPEYEGIADLNVVKQLHASSDKTVEEIIKETYGKFVSSPTKGFEATKGTTEEPVTSYAGKSGKEVKEAIKDPHAKKAYSKDVISRMRKSL